MSKKEPFSIKKGLKWSLSENVDEASADAEKKVNKVVSENLNRDKNRIEIECKCHKKIYNPVSLVSLVSSETPTAFLILASWDLVSQCGNNVDKNRDESLINRARKVDQSEALMTRMPLTFLRNSAAHTAPMVPMACLVFLILKVDNVNVDEFLDENLISRVSKIARTES